MIRCCLWKQIVLLFIAACVPFTLNVQQATGDEPVARFLSELKASYEFEVALDYLSQLENSSLCPDDFRRRIPLEKAEVYILSVSRTRDPRQRESLLNQAQATLESFLKTDPEGDLRSNAERTRASLLIARAGMLVEKAKGERVTADEKTNLRGKARTFLQSASKSFEDNRGILQKEIVAMGKPEEAEKRKQLTALQNEYIIVRRMSPSIKEKIADTFDDGDASRNKILEEAATEFVDIFQDYGNRPGGLDSALYAARCYSKLGKYDDALGYLVTDIFTQSDVPAFYEIKKQGAMIALKCWEAKDPLPFNEIITYLAPIIQTIKPNDKKTPDWQRVELGFARACMQKSEKIKADRPRNREERSMMNRLEDAAIDLARNISRAPGPHRETAREMLVQWNKKVGDVAENVEPPKSLSEARDRGREFIADIEDLSNRITTAESQLAAGGADATAIQTQLEENRGELNEKCNQALGLFELALGLATEDTPPDDISYVRYLQSYCYFKLDRHLETIVIGRFLFDRYPDNAGAKESMSLVCKSNWKMYSSANETQRKFEMQQLATNCSDMMSKWPDAAESQTAAQLLTIVSLQNNDLDAAMESFSTITPGSKAAESLYLSMGQTLWQSYLRGKKDGQDRTRLATIRDSAEENLSNGIAKLNAGSLTEYQARALLSLVEVHLEKGDFQGALNRLESDNLAPLDLVKRKHPAANLSKYRLDTYRAAIRAYLSALQTGQDSQTWIEKAQNVIDALAAEFESQPDGQKKLVSVYYKLANELKGQFDAIEDPEKRKSFGRGLDVFLSGIADNSSDTQVLIWCGSTMSSVGSELVEAGADELGKGMFGKAINVFEKVGSNSQQVDSTTKLEMQRRKAMALRGMGQYTKAVDVFKEIMSDPQNRKYLDLQVDATETLQSWAEASKEPQAYVQAVMGGIKIQDGGAKAKNTVLGWQAIKTTAGRQRKPELVYRAVYNLAKCKYEYGKVTSQPEFIESADKELENFKETYPELGGDQWRGKMQELINQIKGDL